MVLFLKGFQTFTLEVISKPMSKKIIKNKNKNTNPHHYDQSNSFLKIIETEMCIKKQKVTPENGSGLASWEMLIIVLDDRSHFQL